MQSSSFPEPFTTPTRTLMLALMLGWTACVHGPQSLHDAGSAAEAAPPMGGDPAQDTASESAEPDPGPTDFEVLTLSANGHSFHARAAGPESGELVLLLHGFPQTSFQWRHALRALGEAGYRAVAPDQRGYSEGARPGAIEDYAAAHLVRDTLGLADALGAARFHLVGHDWGAAVAWITAAYVKDRVLSLTAVSTSHPRLIAQLRATQGSCQADATAIWSQRKEPDAAAKLLADDARELRASFGDLPKPAVDEYVRVLGHEVALNAALNWYRANVDPPEEGPPVPNVEVPTLYVWGDEDPSNCRAAAEANEDFVTGPYAFEAMAGVDHWLAERVPDRFHELLIQHLGKYGSEPGSKRQAFAPAPTAAP